MTDSGEFPKPQLHNILIAEGKDSEVFLLTENGQRQVRKIYDRTKYPSQSTIIEDYASLMNRGHEMTAHNPLTATVFGNDIPIKILPVSQVMWDEQEKAWTTTSPYIEGTNFVRLYTTGIDKQNEPRWYKSSIANLDVPETLSVDDYFDMLGEMEKIQGEIAKRLGLNHLYIGKENMMLTLDKRIVITDLGHNIQDLMQVGIDKKVLLES
jgi:hypothetical protein